MPPRTRRSPHGKTPRDRAREATRRDLLEAGARVLDGQPVGTVFDQLKPSEVAREAGRTIGAFYHHWDTQDDYKHDLIEHVVASDRLPIMAPAAPETLEAEIEGGLSLEDAVLRHAAENFAAVDRSPYLRLQMALWSKHEDPTITEQLKKVYEQTDQALTPLCGTMLSEHGLRPRPPFTLEHIVVVLTALLEGLALRHAVQPEVVPSEPPEPGSDTGWNLFATTVLALVPTVTTPVEPHADLDRADVTGLIRGLREAWDSAT
jgi:AcrR family transcriptional regulator